MTTATAVKQPKDSRRGKGPKWLWGASCLFFLVILFIMFGMLAYFTLKSPKEEALQNFPLITLQNISNDDFNPRLHFNGSWISDHEFTYDVDGDKYKFNAETLTSTKIVAEVEGKPGAKLLGYGRHVSPDKTYFLIQYRNGSKTSVYAYNKISGKEILILPETMPLDDVEFIIWGKKGTQLIYQYKGNLYHKPSVNEESVQITYDGELREISYEFFGVSRNGESLCYLKENSSLVGESAYILYGSYDNKTNVYPQVLKYPRTRPGLNISIMSIWLVNLSNNRKIKITPPRDLREKNLISSSANWAGSNALVVGWTTRVQNFAMLTLCSKAERWSCRPIHKEYKEKGWLDYYYWFSKIYLVPDDQNLFVLISSSQGSSGSYKHIAWIDLKTRAKKVITRGNYDVAKLLSFDSVSKTLFYLANVEGHPGERHLFSWRPGEDPSCHTCGGACLYSGYTFSRGRPLYYARLCKGPGVPRVELYRTRDHGLVKIWEDAKHIEEEMAKLLMPQIQDLKVPLPGGYEARVRLYIPPFRKRGYRYPLVIETYGGPSFQEVKETFDIHWGHYLATAKSYVYAKLDTRGSGGRGDDLMFEMDKGLGTVEIEDRITVAKYIIQNMDFIDPIRIAIWGHSYGGYAASMVLASESEVIRCAIASAPVTNFRLYHQVYSEKYMGSPEDNDEAYERANLMNKVENMKGKKFLLIHGLADDNVNFQHSALLIKALVDKEISFKLMVYPDVDHSVNAGPKQRLHYFQLKEEFLEKECFGSHSSSKPNL